ncbi:MAG: hypothetical protein ACR2PT_15900 [Endozoicomonas sp.]
MVDSVGSGGVTRNLGVTSEPVMSPEVAPSQEVSLGYGSENTVSVSESPAQSSPNVEVSLDSPQPAPVPEPDLLQKAFEAKLDGFRAAVHEFNRRFNAQDIDINDGQSLMMLIKGMISDTQALFSAESISQVFGYRLSEQLQRESRADDARVLKGDINDRAQDIGGKSQAVQEHSDTIDDKNASKSLREQQLSTAQQQLELQDGILDLGGEIESLNNTLTEQTTELSQSRELVQTKQQELAALLADASTEAAPGELDAGTDPVEVDTLESGALEADAPEGGSDEPRITDEGGSGGGASGGDSSGDESAGGGNREQITALEEEIQQLESGVSRQYTQIMESTSLLAQKEGVRQQKIQHLADIQLQYSASGGNARELEPLEQEVARLQTEIQEFGDLLTYRSEEVAQKQAEKLHKQQELAEALSSDAPAESVDAPPESSLKAGSRAGLGENDNSEQIARLQQEIQQLDIDIASMQIEAEYYSAQLDQKQTEKLQMKADLSEVIIQQLQGDIVQLKTDISGLESEVATLQQQVQQLESENAVDSATLVGVQRVLDSVTEEFVNLNNLLGRVKQRFDPVAMETGEEGVQEVRELEQQAQTAATREQLKLNEMKEVLDSYSEVIVDGEISARAEEIDDLYVGVQPVTTTEAGAQTQAASAAYGLLSDIELGDLAAVFTPRDTTFLEQLIAALEKEESRREREDELPIPEEGFAIVLQSFGQSDNQALDEAEVDPTSGAVLGGNLSLEGAGKPQVFAQIGNPAQREAEVDPTSGAVLGDSLSLEGADNPQVFARLMLEGRMEETMADAASQEALLEEGLSRSSTDRQTVAEALQELQSVPDELAEAQREHDELVSGLNRSRFG